MSVIVTNLTSKNLLEQSIDEAIPLYLQEGETVQGMLSKFKYNKVELIQFLRAREFEKYKKPLPKAAAQPTPEPKEQPKAKKPADKHNPPERNTRSKKPTTKQSTQGGLF